MKHKNIIHRIPVDKEMMIKGIASLLCINRELPTKKQIRSHLSWISWYCGYGALEDQPECIRDLYPEACEIYNKLYPK